MLEWCPIAHEYVRCSIWTSRTLEDSVGDKKNTDFSDGSHGDSAISNMYQVSRTGVLNLFCLAEPLPDLVGPWNPTAEPFWLPRNPDAEPLLTRTLPTRRIPEEPSNHLAHPFWPVHKRLFHGNSIVLIRYHEC